MLRALKDLPACDVHGPVGALDALRWCANRSPSCVIVHLELLDISGSELAQLLRGRRALERLPILLFSSRTGGYLPPATYLAHADALFSRGEIGNLGPTILKLFAKSAGSRSTATLTTYESGSLTVNFERIQIIVEGEEIDLTRRELSLLRFLVTHRNHVLTRHDILVNVWKGENDGQSRTIDTHIRRLRVKLGKVGKQIQTVPGVGYRFRGA